MYAIAVLIDFAKQMPFWIKETIWAWFGPKLYNLISQELLQSFFKNILAWWNMID